MELVRRQRDADLYEVAAVVHEKGFVGGVVPALALERAGGLGRVYHPARYDLPVVAGRIDP